MRHIARIIVDYTVLRQVLGLPDDARIVGVREGGRLFAIEVKVEHPDCPEVEEGSIIPVVEPTFEWCDMEGKEILTDWGV